MSRNAVMSRLLVGLTLSAMVFRLAAEPIRWDNHPDGRTHWYELVDDGTTQWLSAAVSATELVNDECPWAVGFLATITSAEETAFIANNLLQFSGTHSCFVGGYRDNGGSWSWLPGDAAEWSYTNWDPGEPSGDPDPWGQGLVVLNSGAGNGAHQLFAGWNDIAQSWDPYPNYGYIVEWVADEILVDIDIKPGSVVNTINLGSKGVVPVAVLSTSAFDATTILPATVEFAGARVAVRGKKESMLAHEEDVNGDGLVDLVLQFETGDLELGTLDDGIAVLTGVTTAYQMVVGADEVELVGRRRD